LARSAITPSCHAGDRADQGVRAHTHQGCRFVLLELETPEDLGRTTFQGNRETKRTISDRPQNLGWIKKDAR